MILRALYLASGHNFFGHHGRPAGDHPMQAVDTVECLAGRGLVGDRFLDYRPGYKGQITLFSSEVLEDLKTEFRLPHLSAAALRRNVLVASLDLTLHIGRRFVLQGVELEGMEECRPCYWMDQAIGPGAEAWLRGRGGLRCRIHSHGCLRADPGFRLASTGEAAA